MPSPADLEIVIPGWARPTGSPQLAIEEVEKRALDAGVELVTDIGLTLGLTETTLEEVAQRARVPVGSLYQLWPTRDDYYAALLVEVIRPNDKQQGASFDPETLAVAERVVEENVGRLGTLEGRRQVMIEAIRLGAQRNYEFISSSPQWRIFTALLVSLPSLDEQNRATVYNALLYAENWFLDRMTGFYDRMFVLFKARPKPGITTRHIAAAGAGVVEGLAARWRVTEEASEKPLSLPGIDGKNVDWHLAAVGFAGVVMWMIELLDDLED